MYIYDIYIYIHIYICIYYVRMNIWHIVRYIFIRACIYTYIFILLRCISVFLGFFLVVENRRLLTLAGLRRRGFSAGVVSNVCVW